METYRSIALKHDNKKNKKPLLRRYFCNLLPVVSDQMYDYIIMDRIISEKHNGQYTLPIPKDDIRYDVRSLDKYCRQVGKNPEDLTSDELEQFRMN